MRISNNQLWNIIRFIITTIVLFVVWIIFSSDFSLFWLLFGLCIAIIISLFTYKLFINIDEAARHALIPRPFNLIRTYIFLIYSMYVSSWKVFCSVFTRNINPRVVHIKTKLSSDIGRAALANAITFTPGTVVINLDEDHITVHWLFVVSRHSKAAGDEIKRNLEISLRRVWL